MMNRKGAKNETKVNGTEDINESINNTSSQKRSLRSSIKSNNSKSLTNDDSKNNDASNTTKTNDLDQNCSMDSHEMSTDKDPNKNNLDASKTEDQDQFEYKINDIVWGKVAGYDYWPARIIELVKTDETNKSKQRGGSKINKNGNNFVSKQEYKVCFFGQKAQFSIVASDKLRAYECAKKEEYKKKSKSDSKLKLAIEEAEKAIKNNFIFFDPAGLNGHTNKLKKGDFMSFDEELKLINGTSATTGADSKVEENSRNCLNQNVDSANDENEKIEKTSDNVNDESILNDTKSQNSEIGATSTPTLVDRKKRSSAAIASTNLLNMAKANRQGPSEIRTQRAKLSRLTSEEFADHFENVKKKFEIFKSITQDQESNRSFVKITKNNNKRNRSFEANNDENIKNEDNEIFLKTEIKSNNLQKTSKYKKRRTLNELDESNNDNAKNNDSNKLSEIHAEESRSSSPINLSFDLYDTLTCNDENECSTAINLDVKLITMILSSKSANCFDLLKDILSGLNESCEKYLTKKNNDTLDQEEHDKFEQESEKTKQVDVRIYDISFQLRNKNDVSSNNCSSTTNVNFDINNLCNQTYKLLNITYANEFDLAVKNSQLIISILSDASTNNNDRERDNELNDSFEKYEQNLFSYHDFKDLKYVSFGRLSYENALFYHYYFAHNDADFIEASVINHLDGESNSTKKSIYVSCNNHSIFDSIKYLFESIYKNDIIYKGKQFGFPNLYLNIANPILASVNMLVNAAFDKTIKKVKMIEDEKNDREDFNYKNNFEMINQISNELKACINKSIDSCVQSFKLRQTNAITLSSQEDWKSECLNEFKKILDNFSK